MNDNEKFQQFGAELRLTEDQAKGLAERLPKTGVLQILDDEPLCMARRIEELEAQVEKLTNRLAWRNTGSPNGLRRFMTQKQYAAQTPGVQKWYEPIRHEVPEGWQLVPVEPTEMMLRAMRAYALVGSCYQAMLAAAPSPDSDK